MDIKSILATICVLSAIGLAIAGLIIPPTGVIDTSLIWFFAQLLVFAGTILELPNLKLIADMKDPTTKK